MSNPHVHNDTESILLTPLFLESQQSRALLLPNQDTDTDTVAPSGNPSSSDSNDPNGTVTSKDTNSVFVIRQAAATCDSGEPPARKEAAAYVQWALEILVLSFAGGIFVSICLILFYYHDKALPDWDSLRITLNALISILATVLRATIAFVAFEVLAQLKWEWMSTRFRPLNHVQLFDAASRGVYGSLRLLPTIVWHEPIAVTAIVIVVLSLGIGSFTQQSIQTYPCLRNASNGHGTAFIRVANTIGKYDLTDHWVTQGKGTRRMNLKMQITIQDAIVNGVDEFDLVPLFECSSRNCTFPNLFNFTQDDEIKSYSHASMGVCNKCTDIHSLVRGPVNYGMENRTVLGFELPFGPLDLVHWRGHEGRGKAIIYGKSDPTLRSMTTTTVDDFAWARDAVTQEFLDLARTSVVNFTILTASQSGCDLLEGGNVSCPHDCDNKVTSTDATCLLRHEGSYDPVAAACTLYPCFKYHIASVTNARLNESVVQEVPLQLLGRGSPSDTYNAWVAEGNASLAALQQGCQTDKNISLNPNHDLEHATNTEALLNIAAPECVFEMPQSLWIGLWNELLLGLNSNCTLTRDVGIECKVRGENVRSYPTHLAALYHNGSASVETINDTFDALAIRLTTALRREGKRLGRGEQAMVRGIVQEAKVCVSFVWPWLVFPGVLLAICTVLLMAIVIKDTAAKKASIWKSSILPFLLKADIEGKDTGLNGLEQVAQGLEIKLQREKSRREL